MNPIVIRIALSFVVAGVWIAAATLLGERLGTKKAGLLANMPSNILVSLLFMALTKGPEYASAATAGVPMGMMVDSVFIVVFIFSLGLGIGAALGLSLAAWALCAIFVLRVLPPLGFGASLLIYVIVAACLFLFAQATLRVGKVGKKPVVFSWKIAAIRAFFAGSVVAGAVTVAQIAPPYMTGVLATFPAALTSTLVILAKSQGKAFAQATGKMLILSSGNIIVYASSAGILFPLIGPWLGTLVSFGVSIVFVLLLGKLTTKLS